MAIPLRTDIDKLHAILYLRDAGETLPRDWVERLIQLSLIELDPGSVGGIVVTPYGEELLRS